MTEQESLTILCQSLDALTSVHEDGIVHRDIKPENVLVRSRNPLHVKLSDFGLSKATADLQTFCGTHLYAAPEIYIKHRTAYYTSACDIWSLGVVIFRYAYGPLPDIKKTDVGLSWCREIIKLVDDWDSDILLDFLSTAMLAMKPEKRLPTRECWEQALQLSVLSQSRCATPTQRSYPAGDCLKETSAFQKHNHSLQYSKTGSSQATVDQYLVDHDVGEQEVGGQRSPAKSLNEVRKHLV